MKKRLLLTLAIVVSLTVIWGSKAAKAEPSQILTKATASATSTVSYLAAGTATTSLSWDTQEDGGFSMDTAALNIQFAGSSTASVLRIEIQHSQDDINWYPSGGSFVSGFATTSKPFDLSQISQFNYHFSSTTQNSIAVTNANSATSTRSLEVRVPERYIRAIFTLPVGSAGGAVWAQFVGKRQNR
jgi:hypothetical protein